MPLNQLWRIEGVLKTLSPLHVGDGGTGVSSHSKDADVATVCQDAANRPYIPGSSLRGFLRDAFGRRFGTDSDEFRSLFGVQHERTGTGPAGALGGLLGVWDATLAAAAVPDPKLIQEAPHVVINRKTRTAHDGLLYFEQFVPAGTAFRVNLVIECAQSNAGEDVERLVGQLLWLLEELRNDTARLGSNTATGYGRVEWAEPKVSRLTKDSFTAWASGKGQLIDCLQQERSIARLPPAAVADAKRKTLRIPVVIRFSGPFLVNQPLDGKKKGEGPQKGAPEANHEPATTPEGYCRLPGSSLHGSLRAQTERIARTIAGENAERWVRDVSAPAGETATPAAVDCLWGTVGLRSPVRLSDFVAKERGEAVSQEFVAIDRFTGGGADRLKFTARAFIKPELHGEMCIDLDMWRALVERHARAGHPPPSVRPGSPAQGPDAWNEVWKLFVFCIRDWIEGDIRLGFGAAKGYGHCTVTLKDYASPRDLFQTIVQELTV